MVVVGDDGGLVVVGVGVLVVVLVVEGVCVMFGCGCSRNGIGFPICLKIIQISTKSLGLLSDTFILINKRIVCGNLHVFYSIRSTRLVDICLSSVHLAPANF